MVLKEEREGMILLRINIKGKTLPMETEQWFESYHLSLILTVDSSIKSIVLIPGMVVKNLM